MVTDLIECLTVLLEYIDCKRLGGPGPCHTRATAWYTRVSTILKVLSLALNTVNNLFLQALVTIYVYKR